MTAPTAEQLTRFTRFTRIARRPWNRLTPTGRALAALLAQAEQDSVRQREHAAADGMPSTLFAVESRPESNTAAACTTVMNAVLRRNLLAPLSVTVGQRVVRVCVQPKNLGQWEKWVAAVGATPGAVTHKGSWSQAKGTCGGVPVVLVGHGVGALYVAEARTGGRR